MRILLTNDDGIHAHGLRSLYRSLIKAGHIVHVAAPMSEQSGVGHSITIHGPIKVKEIHEPSFSGFGVHGTPSDCVKLGVSELLPAKPDIIVSGINAGANVGPDILYSGTVAAATEGAHLGYPSFAVSYDSFSVKDIDASADFAVKVMQDFPWDKIPPRRVINLNLPDCPMDECKGLVLCPQTKTVWNDWYHTYKDPRNNPYWWLDGRIPMETVEEGSDKDLLTKGYATLTPLKFEFTDTETIGLLGQTLADKLFKG